MSDNLSMQQYMRHLAWNDKFGKLA